MIKWILALSLLFTINQILVAQSFIGGNFGITPYSQASSPVFRAGIGGNLAFKYFRSGSRAIGAFLGYYSSRSKYLNTPFPEALPARMIYSERMRTIPLGVSYEHYFTESAIKPYLGIDVGTIIYQYSYTYEDNSRNSQVEITNGKYFISPKIGSKFKIYQGLHVGLECKLDVVIAPVEAVSYPDPIDEPIIFIQIPLNVGLYYFIAGL